MQLSPRYGSDPLITLDGPPSGVLAPAVRQRRRLVAALEGLDAAQWAHPSRCEGWSTRDVIVHLDSTNAFWAFSIGAGVKGEPTQFLVGFDPAASPAELVAAAGDTTDAEVLERFSASTEALASLLESLDEAAWSALAEAPPGHLHVGAVVHHALWDAWIHERDVLLPLGIEPEVHDDEVAACLRYVAALAPAFAVSLGSHGSGRLRIDATRPARSFEVEVGDEVLVRDAVSDGADGTGAEVRLTGDAVELLEALSSRAPLAQPVPDGAEWMVEGLAKAFDQA